MCGLSGIVAYTPQGYAVLDRISESLASIVHRGPDFQNIYRQENLAVAHARLSILDPLPAAHQPLFTPDKKYFILHNGEIFNFREIRADLQKKGISFQTSSDTEVILNLFESTGIASFSRLDGFFATLVADYNDQCLYLARDPVGVKPVYYYSDENLFVFSSELQGLLAFGVTRELDMDSLYAYLQLNYVPQPWSILKNVRQIRPGHYLKVKLQEPDINEVPYTEANGDSKGEQPKHAVGNETAIFAGLFQLAVKKRLIADVPLGAFLSGGLDSTAVVAVASSINPGLKTFTISFKDDPYFDESRYAEEIARIFHTDHLTIALTTRDMLDAIPEMLDHFSEPFGDSSAIAVYVLSKVVGNRVKVALSGDGGDELLGGYNKHIAESLLRRRKTVLKSLLPLHPLVSILPQNRNSTTGNKARQLNRMLEGLTLPAGERYWRWCCVQASRQVDQLIQFKDLLENFNERQAAYIKEVSDFPDDFNRVLRSDHQLVLLSDMLVKVDRMSMAHALEVRSPFLDHSLVRYCNQLPVEKKIKGRNTKIILRDFLRDKVPDSFLHHPKQGFEVPLQKWLKGELKEKYFGDLFNRDFIEDQKIFNPLGIKELLNKLDSRNPGDSAAQVWGLLVFQYWWKKYLE